MTTRELVREIVVVATIAGAALTAAAFALLAVMP